MNISNFGDVAATIEKRGVAANLLLGNGFSIAAFPQIFFYQNIFRNADFSDHKQLANVFESLETHDFEKVMEYLQSLKKTQGIFTSADVDFDKEIEFLRDILIKTISKSHPDRPDSISDEKYNKTGNFLKFFLKSRGGKKGNIFTVNYDLLLYWTINRTNITKYCKDGFTITDEGKDYLIWSGEYSAHFSDIFFLHGALHLFDAGTAIKKNTWNRTDIGLIDQTRSALEEGYFPIFVSEATSAEKTEKILHNPYLYSSFRKFCSEMNGAVDKNGTEKSCLVIYGHSLDRSDDHILNAIPKGKVASVYVSLHGDPNSDTNERIVERCNYFKAKRGKELDFTYFSAESVELWQ